MCTMDHAPDMLIAHCVALAIFFKRKPDDNSEHHCWTDWNRFNFKKPKLQKQKPNLLNVMQIFRSHIFYDNVCRISLGNQSKPDQKSLDS